MTKPEYRFEFRIVDVTEEETVLKGDTYMSEIDTDGGCESVDMAIPSFFRAFKSRIREEYEEKNYKSNDDDDE